MPQTVTACFDAGRFGISLHFFLNAFRGERPMRAFLIPEDEPAGDLRRSCWKTGTESSKHVGGGIDDAILPSFAVVNPYGLLRPINVTEAEAGDFAHA